MLYFFVDNSLLFSAVKNFFQNRLTLDEIITKIRHQVFWDTVYIRKIRRHGRILIIILISGKTQSELLGYKSFVDNLLVAIVCGF